MLPVLCNQAPPLACREASLPITSSLPMMPGARLMLPPFCRIGAVPAAPPSREKKSLVHRPLTSRLTPSPT